MSERQAYIYPLIHAGREISYNSAPTDPLSFAVHNGIYHHVSNFGDDLSHVKLYIDGVARYPKASKGEQEVFDDINNTPHSPLRTIARVLRNRGATIVPVEDPALIDDMMYLSVQAEFVPLFSSEAELSDQASIVIRKRDMAMGRVVNQDLQPSEIGLIFIGLGHAIEDYLENMSVTIPDEMLTVFDRQHLRDRFARAFVKKVFRKQEKLKYRSRFSEDLSFFPFNIKGLYLPDLYEGAPFSLIDELE